MGAQNLYIHDIRAVSCVFGSILVNEGLGEQAFAVERPEAFTTKKGADGSVTRLATNDFTASWKIRLQRGSRHNAELEAAFALDRATPNGAGVRPFELRDLNGTVYLRYAKAWISQPANLELGTDDAEREWTITATDEQASG